MSLSDVQVEVVDNQLGIEADSLENAVLLIGVCSSGTENTRKSFSDVSKLREAMGTGPLVEEAALLLTTPTQGRTVRPVHVCRIDTDGTGSVGSVTTTRSGSSTGTLSLSGSAPLDSWEMRVKVTRAGTRGTAAFRLSYDGGETYGAEVTVPSDGVYSPSSTGLTLTFSSGTLDVDDLFSFDAIEPRFSSTELGTCLDALFLDATEWSLVKVVGTPAPEMSSVTATGTTPPTVTLTGTPTIYADIIIDITTGGARGTAVFRWSSDGGATYTTGVTTAATVTLTGTGLTANFATGSDYNTDNLYVAHSGKALRDRADVLKTKLATAETVFRFARGRLDAPDASDAVLQAAMLSFESLRVGVYAGFVRSLSPISSRRYKRPAGRSIFARVAAIAPHIDPAWVTLGPLPDVVHLFRDERVTEALDASKFGTLRTIIGLRGAYVTNDRNFAGEGSDYEFITNARVMDKACRTTRLALLPFLSEALRVNPSTSTVEAGNPGAPGTLFENEARRIDGAVSARLRTALLQSENASSFTVQTNRTDNILSTETLRAKVRVVPKAYAKQIEVEIGLENPALAA